MTPSELFAESVCNKTFLRFWSFASPKRNDKKELCDLLIIHKNTSIILSIKECILKTTGDLEVNIKRWERSAIGESVSQIYGAEKYVKSGKPITTSDGKHLISNTSDKPIIYRIALAIGDNDKLPRGMKNFGKGIVHTMNATDFETILSELDTISDFSQYLHSKESHLIEHNANFISESERDLLAFYLLRGKSFRSKDSTTFLHSGFYTDLVANPKYKAKKEADKISYVWDDIINTYSDLFFKGNLIEGNPLAVLQKSIQQMAAEDRFSRRILSHAWYTFMHTTNDDLIHARYIESKHTGTSYVFLACPARMSRKQRKVELESRTIFARRRFKNNKYVVGIGTENYSSSPEISYDLLFVEQELWSHENEESYISDVLPLMGQFKETPFDVYEYPFERKYLPNQVCPCGSGRKYKKCCMYS